MAAREFVIEQWQAGMRLDRVLLDAHPEASRRALTLLVSGGGVRVNGRRARKGDRVSVGDVVWFDPEKATVIARPGLGESLPVVLSTNELLIVDKPAGMPSTAAPGRFEGTAAGHLVVLFPEIAGIGFGPREPGLVHRLDTQTSGLLLAARSAPAFASLRESMQAGAIQKRYLAIAYGLAPPEGRIDTALGPDPKSPRRVRTLGTPGERVTSFRRLDARGGYSLLEVSLARGYRHQIRVHLASIGLPLAGDVLYGGPGAGLAPRHALHASFLESTDASLPFRAELGLPQDLADFWSALPSKTPDFG